MPARIRMLIAATGLTLGMGGCDRGWRVFQQVELGQVLPQQSLLRPRRNEAGTAGYAIDAQATEPLTWSDCGAWPVPPSFGMHVVAVRTDGEGRVIAKSYYAQAWSNYILLTSAAVRRVVELQVPPRMLLEPMAKTEDDGLLVGVERTRTLRGYLINAMHEVNLSPDCDGEPSVPLLLVTGASFMAGMSVGGGFHDLEWSIEHLPLEEIAQDGYDRTFRPVPGGSIRIQNLGQRRIRIEANLLRLYDPLALAAYMYMQPECPAAGLSPAAGARGLGTGAAGAESARRASREARSGREGGGPGTPRRQDRHTALTEGRPGKPPDATGSSERPRIPARRDGLEFIREIANNSVIQGTLL